MTSTPRGPQLPPDLPADLAHLIEKRVEGERRAADEQLETDEDPASRPANSTDDDSASTAGKAERRQQTRRENDRRSD